MKCLTYLYDEWTDTPAAIKVVAKPYELVNKQFQAESGLLPYTIARLWGHVVLG